MALTKVAVNMTWLKNRALVAGMGALGGGILGTAYDEDLHSGLVGAAIGAPALLGVSALTRGKAIRELLAKRNALGEEFKGLHKEVAEIKKTPLLKRKLSDIGKVWKAKGRTSKIREEIGKLHEDIRTIKNERLF